MSSANMARARKMMDIASALIAEESIGKPTFPIPGGNAGIAEILRSQFGDYQTELFVAMYFDQGGKLLGIKKFAEGSRTKTVLYPRLVFKAGFELNATGMIIAHNHPGGSVEPSQPDRNLTRILQSIGENLEMHLKDHFILTADGRYTSFAEKGYL